MSHTPEPWWFDHQTPYISSNATAELRNLWCIKTIDTGRHYGNEMAVANARRIVACVNACSGVQTETLERVPLNLTTRKMVERIEQSEKERDTYRDLCAELKEVLRNHYWNDCTKHSKAIETLITKAESILGEKNGNAK